MAERAPALAPAKKTHIAAIKILAILLVIFNHTKEDGFRRFIDAPDSPFFPFFLFMSIACKVAVPLFFMCSGALLLGKDEPLKKLFSHRVLRYAVALVLFSFVEYLSALMYDYSRFDLGYFFLRIYRSDMHGVFWFLYAYLACLLMLPFLRKIARGMDGQEAGYLIALQLVFVGVIPALEQLIGKGAFHLNPDLSLPILSQGIFYMLIGYWIENRLDLSRVKGRHLAALALAGFAAVVVSCLLTVNKGGVDGRYATDLSLTFHSSFIAIPTIVVYILAKCAFTRIEMQETTVHSILFLGDLTFGIYLIHIAVMRVLTHFTRHMVPYTGPFATSLVLVVLTAVVAGAITAVMKRIPYLSKLL